MYSKRITIYVILVLMLIMVMTVGLVQAAPPQPNQVQFWLTVLHNNDGESQVIDAGEGLEDFGGAARFKALVDELKWEAVHGPRFAGEQDNQFGAKRGVMMISSGDNFLAGPEFTASLAQGVPFYDTIAMELIGYDTVSFGNHDFDFGPDVLADFLAGYTNPPPYLGANLDFSAEPVLQAYVDAGVISAATIIKERGELIGVIGLETPNLPFNSSPRDVVVSDDLANIVQGQVDMLEANGVNKIILAGHLQDIDNDVELAAQLDGIDVIVAGGGDELLANPGDLLLPGDEAAIYGTYPQFANDVDGTQIPIVTTSGEYRYVGRLVVGFDKDGNVIAVGENSGPVRVVTGDCNGTQPCDDAVAPDPVMQSLVVDPVVAYLDGLASNIVATSEVALDGLRSSVRSMETNEGNLIADSQRWQAEQLAPDYGVPVPDVALQNGGGIRNNTIVPAGDITELDTFDMAPFPNFVSIVPDIPREQFKEILENAVACTQSDDFDLNPNCGTGRFAQVSGFSFTWSSSGTGLILDLDGNVLVAGTRVQDVILDDGTVIVAAGVVQTGDPITIATADFLAKSGDQYPFRGAPFTTIGITYQQALANYLEQGLGGLIGAAQYPEGGEGRITVLP